MIFKSAIANNGEAFWSPGGYYIVVSPEIGADSWYVRILDFATWKHRRFNFPTEMQARTEADRWRL